MDKWWDRPVSKADEDEDDMAFCIFWPVQALLPQAPKSLPTSCLLTSYLPTLPHYRVPTPAVRRTSRYGYSVPIPSATTPWCYPSTPPSFHALLPFFSRHPRPVSNQSAAASPPGPTSWSMAIWTLGRAPLCHQSRCLFSLPSCTAPCALAGFPVGLCEQSGSVGVYVEARRRRGAS